MRIVFFGTSDVGLPILEALQSQHEIIHIVTSPDSKVGRRQEMTATPIAQFAEKHSIATSKPEKVKNNPDFIEFLKTLSADIFVVVSYGKILPAELLEIPKLKTINVHFSLLPKYRGPAPIQFALMNDETTTGTTIFVLDELVDHGPVLAQKEIAVDSQDTFITLAEKLSHLSADLILGVLPKYLSGEIIPKEQDHSLATKSEIILKEHGKINWEQKTAQEIYNIYRAFTPWPGIWTTYQNEVFKIISCAPFEVPENPLPGELFEMPEDIIPCRNNTFLKLLEVQIAGKNKMTMKDFLNGHPNFRTQDLV